MHPYVIAAFFTIAKIWNQPKFPLVNEWIKKLLVHLQNEILYSTKREGSLTLCDSMDGT